MMMRSPSSFWKNLFKIYTSSYHEPADKPRRKFPEKLDGIAFSILHKSSSVEKRAVQQPQLFAPPHLVDKLPSKVRAVEHLGNPLSSFVQKYYLIHIIPPSKPVFRTKRKFSIELVRARAKNQNIIGQYLDAVRLPAHQIRRLADVIPKIRR